MKKNGWDGSEDSDALQWTFFGALFYSIIVITTIGRTVYFSLTTKSNEIIFIENIFSYNQDHVSRNGLHKI